MYFENQNLLYFYQKTSVSNPWLLNVSNLVIYSNESPFWLLNRVGMSIVNEVLDYSQYANIKAVFLELKTASLDAADNEGEQTIKQLLCELLIQ